jgi:hypothetical protein
LINFKDFADCKILFIFVEIKIELDSNQKDYNMEKSVVSNQVKKHNSTKIVGLKSPKSKVVVLKNELMTQIKSIQNEETLEAVNEMLKALSTKQLIYQITKPKRETLTVEDLIKEQNYKGFDRTGFDKLVAELAVQEPIEELLALSTQ